MLEKKVCDKYCKKFNLLQKIFSNLSTYSDSFKIIEKINKELIHLGILLKKFFLLRIEIT